MGRFLQSKNDFPLMVSLGEKSPTWGIARWRGNSGLRFIPPDDEGFSLRGDRRRLLYKGRRRTHRFTILGDGAFEYDCILLREPESNVITLRMDGADRFDFFRQPDFVKNDFLKGSYAVYKKETFIGEGTGKLCHIHRPEIIDARGRRCWGELSVVGDELRITIPEKWLGEAKYPVVVDPTVGTTTVGSQTYYDNVENESYDQLFFWNALGVNRFMLYDRLDINAIATAYVYAYEPECFGRCMPILYTDNNGVPLTRRSSNEGNFDIQVKSGKPAGWRSTTFKISNSIVMASYVWFGLFCDEFAPRFDYGAKCYWDYWDAKGNTSIPNTYPLWSANWYFNFKLSMYFTHSLAQNYVRTITQGVKLTDNRILSRGLKRNTAQTAGVTSPISRIQELFRKEEATVLGNVNVGGFEAIYRRCLDTVQGLSIINRLPVFFRGVMDAISGTDEKLEEIHFTRETIECVSVETEVKKSHSIFRKAEEILSGIDNQEFTVLFYRCITDATAITQANRGIRVFFREVKSTVENFDGIQHGVDFYRYSTDMVDVASSLFRKLDIFLRITTQLLVREFFLQRFLRAKSEIVLKSCVTREIILESKIA